MNRQAITLYRDLLRMASNLNLSNQMYVRQRIREAFKVNSTLMDPLLINRSIKVVYITLMITEGKIFFVQFRTFVVFDFDL